MNVIECQTPFEKRVYFATLAAAMTAVAVTVVDLSERQWAAEALAAACAGLFVAGVLVARQLLAWVDEDYRFENGILLRRRQVGPFTWDFEEATRADLACVHARGHGVMGWVEVETRDGRRIRLSDIVTVRDHTRMPDELADVAARLSKLFGVPVQEWAPTGYCSPRSLRPMRPSLR